MDILGLKNWIVQHQEENEVRFLIRADYALSPENCQKCFASFSRIYKHDKRTKKVKDFQIRSKLTIILLSVQRYKCLSCKKIFTQKVPEIAEGMRITKRLLAYIEKQSVEASFHFVSRQTGVSENLVREIFTRYAKRIQTQKSFPTPRILGMDGVYGNRKERCIIADIENRRVIEMLPDVRKFTVVKYLLELRDKSNIKAVTMDMTRGFRTAVERILPDAKIVIDKYHIQRMGNKAVTTFLQKVRESCRSSEKKKYLHNRFILYKRSYNLTKIERKRIRGWSRELPHLAEVYNLKEKFLEIWNYQTRKKAEKAYKTWESTIPRYLKAIFKEILTAFKGWSEQIFNYFDHRVTNAYVESANNLFKMLQKNSRGMSFDLARAKMLCRSFAKLSESDAKPPPVPHNLGFIKPKRTQRILRLKQVRQQNSEVFAILSPTNPSWIKRFEPHLLRILKND